MFYQLNEPRGLKVEKVLTAILSDDGDDKSNISAEMMDILTVVLFWIIQLVWLWIRRL